MPATETPSATLEPDVPPSRILISAVVLVAADAPSSAAGLLRYEDAGIDGVPVWKVLVGGLSLLTRSLWIAVGIHGGLHVTVLAATLLERVDPAFAGGNGPAPWLLAGLGWTLVAAVAMWVLARRTRQAAVDAVSDRRHPADVG